MKYRILGQTGLKVSEIGLGAFPISGMWEQPDGTPFGWTGTDDQESIALIHRCEALGINLLDTAEGYGDGHSETLTGQALKGRREKWVVATKVQPNQGIDPEARDEAAVRRRITEACEQSLKRLQMETIDLYQLHAIPYEWAAIDKLRALGPIHILQIGYNLLERTADSLLHWAKQENIGTLIRVPLAKGMLTGKYSGQDAAVMPEGDLRYERFNRPESIDALKKLPQLSFLKTPQRTMAQAALRFALDHPGTSCVIAGAKNRRQVEENAAASDFPPLSEAELARAIPIADTIRTPGWI